jgi:hypothetical protein P700755_27646
MFNFTRFVKTYQILSEALVNKHSSHIEDLIFSRGKQGVEDAIQGLKYVVKTIGEQSVRGSVSTKIDGCIDENTRVVTMRGPKMIKELTNDDFVKVYDKVSDSYRYCNNTQPRITGRSKKWVKIHTNNNGFLICTEDHKCLTGRRDWIEAQKMEGRSFYCPEMNNKRLLVERVEKLDGKRDQWDLTTSAANFVIVVGSNEVVIHNSPAVFFGNSSKGFFVASKGIFNKTPKINYTETDIETNHSGGLADTLKVALQWLKKVVPNTKDKVYQGDILFTKDTIKHFQHNGKDLIGFHPNTIIYTVEKDSDIGKTIQNSEIGLAVHTEYEWNGEDPSTLKVSRFGISDDIFKDNSKVFIIDTISNLNPKQPLQFSSEQYDKINSTLKQIEKLAATVTWAIFDQDAQLGQYLETFVNTYIRANKPYPSPDEMTEQFFDWIEQKVADEKGKLKTEKGKARVDQRYASVRDLKKDSIQIETMMKIFKLFSEVKLMIIRKLNEMSLYNNFVMKSNGDLVGTGEEGFVITQTNAKGAKLVDRFEFSKNNFASDIVKSWQHARD